MKYLCRTKRSNQLLHVLSILSNPYKIFKVDHMTFSQQHCMTSILNTPKNILSLTISFSEYIYLTTLPKLSRDLVCLKLSRDTCIFVSIEVFICGFLSSIFMILTWLPGIRSLRQIAPHKSTNWSYVIRNISFLYVGDIPTSIFRRHYAPHKSTSKSYVIQGIASLYIWNPRYSTTYFRIVYASVIVWFCLLHV